MYNLYERRYEFVYWRKKRYEISCEIRLKWKVKVKGRFPVDSVVLTKKKEKNLNDISVHEKFESARYILELSTRFFIFLPFLVKNTNSIKNWPCLFYARVKSTQYFFLFFFCFSYKCTINFCWTRGSVLISKWFCNVAIKRRAFFGTWRSTNLRVRIAFFRTFVHTRTLQPNRSYGLRRQSVSGRCRRRTRLSYLLWSSRRSCPGKILFIRLILIHFIFVLLHQHPNRKIVILFMLLLHLPRVPADYGTAVLQKILLIVFE